MADLFSSLCLHHADKGLASADEQVSQLLWYCNEIAVFPHQCVLHSCEPCLTTIGYSHRHSYFGQRHPESSLTLDNILQGYPAAQLALSFSGSRVKRLIMRFQMANMVATCSSK